MDAHTHENDLFAITWSVIGKNSPSATSYYASIEDAQKGVNAIADRQNHLLAQERHISRIDRADFFVPYDRHIRRVSSANGGKPGAFIQNGEYPDGTIVAMIEPVACDARLSNNSDYEAKPRKLNECWMFVLEQEQSGFVFDYGIMLVGRDYLVMEGPDVRVHASDAVKKDAKRTHIRTKEGSAKLVGYLACGYSRSQIQEAADLGNEKAVVRRCFTQDGSGYPMFELTEGLIAFPAAAEKVISFRNIIFD